MYWFLLQYIFGKVLYPVAYVMGVPTGGVEGGPSDECEFVSQGGNSIGTF